MLLRREASPYAGRIRLVWRQMRGPVIERFPALPGRPHLEIMLLAQRKDFWQLADRAHKEGEKNGFTKLEDLPG